VTEAASERELTEIAENGFVREGLGYELGNGGDVRPIFDHLLLGRHDGNDALFSLARGDARFCVAREVPKTRRAAVEVARV
jgi:hypothetical protein